MPTYPFVQGDTSTKFFRLNSGGVAESIFGMTITAKLVDRFGVEKNTAGDVAILDDGTEENRGRVSWTPDAADVEIGASPYRLRFYVTSGPETKPFPDAAPLVFEVFAP